MGYPTNFHSPSTNNIIVFIGLPGAGKTNYYRRFLAPHDYERVAQVAGTGPETCLDAAHEFLAQGKPVSWLSYPLFRTF
jgi:bifunctional polynucleotide phosphatase/kinase